MPSTFRPDPLGPSPAADPATPPQTHEWAPEPPAAAPGPAEEAAARRSVMLTWLAVAAVSAVLVLRGYGATVISFIATLGILVFVHEWGHYQFARWAGMKVNRFGIGFPPWIYTKRHNGIDYSLGALPIGGMVDIAGLGSEEEMVATARGAEVTAHVVRRYIPHGQLQFQEASLFWRFCTLFAGPLMNFLFAMVIFIGIFSIVGVPDSAATNHVHTVIPQDPAATAGLKEGDYIIGINGLRTADANQLKKLIRGSGGKPITLILKRGNHELTKVVQPVIRDLPKLDSVGAEMERAPAIGIVFYQDPDKVHYIKVSLGEAIDLGWRNAFGISKSILSMIGRALTGHLTSDEKKSVGGPIKIAQAAGESAQQGWQMFALFVASLSVNLGLLNLLPVPALDGGRILFLGYELVARRPLDPKKESLVHMVGMVMVLAFMLFISARDVSPTVTNMLSAFSKHLSKG